MTLCMQHTAILKNLNFKHAGSRAVLDKISSTILDQTNIILSLHPIVFRARIWIFLLLNSYLLEETSFCSSNIILCYPLNCVEPAYAKISHLGHQPVLPLRSMRVRSTVNIGANTEAIIGRNLKILF